MKKKMNLYEKKENCCGCTACKSICPMQAIEMRSDSEGFLYPYMDESICIGCGKCLNVCVFKKKQIMGV